MTLFFHLLWMLCAFGTVIFAAVAARDPRRSAGFAAGFVAGVVLARSGLPDLTAAGGVALVAVAILLFRPRFALVAAALGGGLAGSWSALLQAQGLPFVATPVVVASVIGVSAWLTRSRAGFAPERLVDEGLLAVGALAIAALTLPSILDGWQIAVALAATSTRQASADMPVWTAAFILACTSLGGLYSAWSRR
jgi:hypothetical protein